MCFHLPRDLEMDGEVVKTKLEEVPEEFVESCREAADVCPVEAIIIEE